MSELTIFQNKAQLPNFGDYDKSNLDATAGLAIGVPFLRIDGKELVISSVGQKISIGKSVKGIIIGVGPIAKRHYEGTYSPKVECRPTCASADGETPDAAIENPVSLKCKSCPKAAWGSKITDGSSKAKDCADYRRIAISIRHNKEDVIYRLDVPSYSISPLGKYASMLDINSVPINGVITQISFDSHSEYTRLSFDATAVLTQEQYNYFSGMVKDPRVTEILTRQVSSSFEATEENSKGATEEKIAPAPKKETLKETAKETETSPASSKEVQPETQKIESADELAASLDEMLESGM